MVVPFDFAFVQNLVADWVNSLLELFNLFVGNSFVNVLDLIIDLNDNFPIIELVNALLIPLRNIVYGTVIGDLTMLEFTLGFGFSLYLVFTLLRWFWDILPFA